MKSRLKLILLLLLPFIINSCQRKERHVIHLTFTLSNRIDSLVKDTTPLTYLLDSLKRLVRQANYDTAVINALNDLAGSYDKWNAQLVTEASGMSKKLNYQYGITDAICRRGVYFERKLHFDSALVYLDRGLEQAQKTNQPKLVALALSFIADTYRLKGDYDKSLQYSRHADSLALTINDIYRVAFSRNIIGDVYRHRSDFSRAQQYYLQTIKLAEQIGVRSLLAYALESLGDVYRLQNDYVTALNYYNHALEMGIKMKSKSRMISCYEAIADVYHLQSDTAKAFFYFNKAIPLAKEAGDNSNLAFCYSIIGTAYMSLNQFDKALDKYTQSMELAQKIDSKNYIAFLNSGIADAYYSKGDYTKSLEYYAKAVEMDTVLGDKDYLSITYRGLGLVNLKIGDAQKAKTYASLSLAYAKEANSIDNIANAADLFYQVGEKLNDYKSALEMHKLYMQMKDSLSNTENIKKFAAAEYNAKEENLKADQEKEKAIILAEEAKKDAEVKKQKTLIYAFIGGLLLLLLFAIFIYRSLQRNRKQTHIISEQKVLVETKNKEVLDSIIYAKRLQEAILPHPDEISKQFPESFVLYKPKDIVAGDFYWMEKINDTVLIAAGDSTGHGVPGAMVSVVCSNVLNTAVKEFGITEPGKILDTARDLLIKTFEKSGNEVADGMDISLCAINIKTGTVKWSGANNPLWYYKNMELKEIMPDKQPIGKYETQKPFTTHTIELRKGDTLYLFTDGFGDQFGGPKGKKFKYKQLQEKITEMASQSVGKQKERLDTIFNEWQGNLEQVDDVLIMGIRI